MVDDEGLLLEVKGLKTHFPLDEGLVRAVDGIDFEIGRRKSVCVVGESGCGKTVMGRSILQIVDPPGRIVAGEIVLHRRPYSHGETAISEVVKITDLNPKGREIRQIRGQDISMIFQEPLTSLSAYYTIGNQITEAVRLHILESEAQAKKRVIDMLTRVGIPKPEQRFDDYPYQLSGGMRQRAMIAMSLVCQPSLLIADEPTTALDVTTQAQILDLLRDLQAELGMSIMLITHDLGVVAEIADDVVVMYLGWVVEKGDVVSVFQDAKHPYTQALLRSVPQVGLTSRERLDTIPGMVPDPYNRPKGCVFHPRCLEAMPGICDVDIPPRQALAGGREVRCWLHSEHRGRDI